MRKSISFTNISADKKGCNYFAVCLPKTVKLSNAIDFELLNLNILLLLSTKCYHIPFVHFSSAFSNCPVFIMILR